MGVGCSEKFAFSSFFRNPPGGRRIQQVPSRQQRAWQGDIHGPRANRQDKTRAMPRARAVKRPHSPMSMIPPCICHNFLDFQRPHRGKFI